MIDGPNAPLYIRGAGFTVGGNTFITGGEFQIDYDGSTDQVATSNVIIGTNTWLAAGSISAGASSSLNSNVIVAPQNAISTLTYTNLGNLVANFVVPGTISNVSSLSGLLTGAKSVSVTTLNNAIILTGAGSASGILHVRDTTNGGSAIFLIDPNQGVQLIGTSQITGLAASGINYTSGNWYITLTTGSVTRVLKWTILQ